MEIKIKSSIEKTITIDFPYYSKSSAHHFKLIDENNTLKITECNNSYSLELYNCIPDYAITDCTQCTEEEFMNAFILIQGKLNAKLI